MNKGGKTIRLQKQRSNSFKKENQKENFSQKICHFIGDHIHAPQFLKDNEYIKQGYRINFQSTKLILKSFFMIHNESINIWTHFLGAMTLIFLTFCLYSSYNNVDINSWKERLYQNVNESLEPLYSHVKQIDQAFEQQMNESIVQMQKNYNQMEETFLHELNQLKEQITPFNIQEIGQKFMNYMSNLEKENIEKYKQDLIEKIETMRNEVIQKIDSHQFDWIDFHMEDYINGSLQIQQKPLHVVSRWPIFVFLFSAILCLLFSTLFHLFYCRNLKYQQFFLRLDLSGVSLLVSGSTFPPFYYGFYCNFHLAYFYLTLVGTVSLVVFLVSIQEFINKPEYFALRSFMQGLLGFFSSIPVGHLIYLEVFKEDHNDTYSTANTIGIYLIVCLCYLFGLIIFAYRCPERYKPGHFDICGASHQLWHVFVLIAIGFTYVGSIINFYTRKMNVCKN